MKQNKNDMAARYRIRIHAIIIVWDKSRKSSATKACLEWLFFCRHAIL